LQQAMAAMSGPKELQRFAKGARISEQKRKVLRAFFDGKRLVSIPAKRKKKEIVLEEILRRLPRRRQYQERQLSKWIEAIHSDFCTIRREFIMGNYMTRKDGFYELTFDDNLPSSCLTIELTDGTGFSYAFVPTTEDVIKYVENNDIPQEEKQMGGRGGPNQADAVAQLLIGHGDLTMTVTDASGNTASAECLVPEPPK